MKTAELVKALLDVDEEVFLLHGEINPHPTVVIVGGAAFLLARSYDAQCHARHRCFRCRFRGSSGYGELPQH